MEDLMAYMDSYDSGGSSVIANLYTIASIVGLWKMFEKAGMPGWYAIIPFYNIYKLCEISMGRPNYAFKLFWIFVPIAGIFVAFYYYYQISVATAAAFGKPREWAWGYLFLSPVFFCITGFDSNASYYGPYGAGDYRTEEARRSQPVNFEVYPNNAETGYQQQSYQDSNNEMAYNKLEVEEEPIRTEILINGVPYKEKKSSDVVIDFDNDNITE